MGSARTRQRDTHAPGFGAAGHNGDSGHGGDSGRRGSRRRGSRRRGGAPDYSIALRLAAAQVIVVTVLAIVGVIALWFYNRNEVTQEATNRGLIVARSVADDPYVLQALVGPDPSGVLQPLAMRRMHDTGTDFVTIMSTDRIRYTHPDPDQIGRVFPGTIAPALQGGEVIETFTGPSGRSVRAVVPVINDEGDVVALVCSGVTIDNVMQEVWSRARWFTAAVFAFVVVVLVSTAFQGGYLRRVTWGLGPERLARMYNSYDHMLRSMHEGLLVIDQDKRVVLANPRAVELLGIDDPENTPVAGLGVSPALRELLASGRRATDELCLTGDRALVVNAEPVAGYGTVTTVRDHTEIERLSTRVQSMQTMADALRAQTHEHANRLYTMVALIETGQPEAARDLAALDLAGAQHLVDTMLRGGDPVLGSLLVGKASDAAERGVEFGVDVAAEITSIKGDPRDIVTIVGNLVDNAFDAAVGDPPWVDVYVGVDDGHEVPGTLVIQVTDSGPGITDPDSAFELGFSTKDPGAAGRGFGLALLRQAVTRRGGSIDVTRTPHSCVTVTLPGAAQVVVPDGDAPASGASDGLGDRQAGAPGDGPRGVAVPEASDERGDQRGGVPGDGPGGVADLVVPHWVADTLEGS